MRTGFVIVVAVVCLALGAGAVAVADDSDSTTTQEYVCANGQWSHARIAGDENDGPLSQVIHADLPDGYSVESYSGKQTITTHSDGRVEGTGGKLTVQCISPTH
jgi:hypothetical protein